MTDPEAQLFEQLQTLRFAIEQIVAGADKRALVLNRCNQAQKLVRRIETELRTVLELGGQEGIAKGINDHLGARGRDEEH